MNELLVLDNDNKSGSSTEDGLSKIAAEASLTYSHPAFQVSVTPRDIQNAKFQILWISIFYNILKTLLMKINIFTNDLFDIDIFKKY